MASKGKNRGMDNPTMKILFVTTDNYPFFGTTTGILKRIMLSGSFTKESTTFSVMSLEKTFYQSRNECIDDVQIYRAFSLMYSPNMLNIDVVREFGCKKFIKWFFMKLSLKIRQCIFKKEAPLLYRENIKAFCKKLKEVNADSYDFIVPIFGAHDSVAAVMKYKPKHAKIVLYQVDPCSTNWTYEKRDNKKNVAFEKEMYKKADAIITMPVIYNDIQHLITDDIKDKFFPIELPLIVDPKVEKNEYNENRKIKCVFSGLIYGGIRDPLYTLKLFENLVESENVELHLVGVTKEELPVEFRSSKIICYGRVLADEAQKIMNSADVLVNIGNLMNNQLPSKIFDYISLGRPIVNVCKNRDCPTLPYMEKYPLSLDLFEEDELLELQKEQLTQFLADSKGKRIEFSEVEKLFENATPKYCADFIYNLLVFLQDKEDTDTI